MEIFKRENSKELYNHFLKTKRLWMKINPSSYWGDDLDVRYRITLYAKNICGKKILDIACNVGITTSFLTIGNNEVYGIDINEEFIKKAQKNFPKVNFITASMDNLPFTNNSFDITLLIHGIPGNDFAIQNPEQFRYKTFSEIYRTLKPRGILIITTPNRLWYQYRRYRLKPNPQKGYLPITAKDIHQLLKNHHFTNITIYGWNNFKSFLGPLQDILIPYINPKLFRYLRIHPRILAKFEKTWEKLEDEFHKSLHIGPKNNYKDYKSLVIVAQKN